MSTLTEVTDASWEADVLGAEHPVLVDFWAPWCGPCKSMMPFVEKLADEFEGKVKVVKLNTQDNAEVAAKYGIVSIPTLMVIKDGEVQSQVVGLQRYDALKTFIEPHI
jgi:thioredoxin 1